MHDDGYVELTDRAKDIISGGENIASVEAEKVLSARLAHFKAPDRVHSGPPPKASIGKVVKHALRAQAQDRARVGRGETAVDGEG